MKRAWAVTALFLAGCGNIPWIFAGGGSGTETSNGELSGRIVQPDGQPAASAAVFVRPADYLADTAALGVSPAPDARTDARGMFRITPLPAGSYRLEARDEKGRALQIDFRKDANVRRIDLAPDTLRPTGALKGKVELPAGAPGLTTVHLYGLERVALADSAGRFAFPDLPPGPQRVLGLSTLPGQSYAGPSPALVTSGDTAVVADLALVNFANEDYSQWPFSRRLYLNTADAGLSAPVADFPLYVRLQPDRFDFSLSDGKDLRFSAEDGARLPFQLDHWEPALGSGGVWVRLDSVAGSSRDRYINMHWGKRDAPDFSDGRAVFSSFAGAWHMSEPLLGDGMGTFRDASPLPADGLAKVSPHDRAGALGSGAHFTGGHSIRVRSDASLMPARGLTVSAWVNVTGTGSLGAEIASMGDNYGLRVSRVGNPWFFLFTDTTRKQNVRMPEPYWPFVTAAGVDLRNAGWRWVTGTYDGQVMRLYVDGVERTQQTVGQDLWYPFGREFRMGMHGNEAYNVTGYEFRGAMDEVQIAPLARSADWIRLAYWNQRPGSVFPEFR